MLPIQREVKTVKITVNSFHHLFNIDHFRQQMCDQETGTKASDLLFKLIFIDFLRKDLIDDAPDICFCEIHSIVAKTHPLIPEFQTY